MVPREHWQMSCTWRGYVPGIDQDDQLALTKVQRQHATASSHGVISMMDTNVQRLASYIYIVSESHLRPFLYTDGTMLDRKGQKQLYSYLKSPKLVPVVLARTLDLSVGKEKGGQASIHHRRTIQFDQKAASLACCRSGCCSRRIIDPYKRI
ncbi:hypothetical protein BD289DRAFT_272152 [Coniella lustricola]|uniref:Uncharacterized protein n=1 Tax=Coniella lustricola TaxID=2025994 RepID=A0A2T3AKP0_9PEZI|nr:hypothetical protein BD289DRAFT_272152 [Coniella lustricola]